MIWLRSCRSRIFQGLRHCTNASMGLLWIVVQNFLNPFGTSCGSATARWISTTRMARLERFLIMMTRTYTTTHKTLYLFGSTCTGKDYFIEMAVQKYPEKFGAVQVGKEFRRRYPDKSHFRNSGAPDHTETEAFQIFKEQHDAAVEAGKQIILVSGQPRRPSQVRKILEYAPGLIIWMFADKEIVQERIKQRFTNDPSGLELAKARVTNDCVELFDTLFTILHKEQEIMTLDLRTVHVEHAVQCLAEYGVIIQEMLKK